MVLKEEREALTLWNNEDETTVKTIKIPSKSQMKMQDQTSKDFSDY